MLAILSLMFVLVLPSSVSAKCISDTISTNGTTVTVVRYYYAADWTSSIYIYNYEEGLGSYTGSVYLSSIQECAARIWKVTYTGEIWPIAI